MPTTDVTTIDVTDTSRGIFASDTGPYTPYGVGASGNIEVTMNHDGTSTWRFVSLTPMEAQQIGEYIYVGIGTGMQETINKMYLEQRSMHIDLYWNESAL